MSKVGRRVFVQGVKERGERKAAYQMNSDEVCKFVGFFFFFPLLCVCSQSSVCVCVLAPVLGQG